MLLLLTACSLVTGAHASSVIDGGAACDNETATTCCPGMYWSKLLERCELCPPGHWAVRSSDHCEACSAGTFQEAHGSTGCKSCAGLGFADADRAIGCRACSFHEHSPEEGSGEACRSCFASARHYMFSHDCARMRFSTCLLILIAVGGWQCSRKVIRLLQGRADDADKADEADKAAQADEAAKQGQGHPLVLASWA